MPPIIFLPHEELCPDGAVFEAEPGTSVIDAAIESDARGEDLAAMLGTPLEFEPARRTDADLIFRAARADDARALRPQLRFFISGRASRVMVTADCRLSLYAWSHASSS